MAKQGKEAAWIGDLLATLPLFSSPIETSKALGWSRRTTDRRLRSGELEYVKNGNKVLIPRTAIAALLSRSA